MRLRRLASVTAPQLVSIHGHVTDSLITVGGVSAAVSKTAAAPIERIKLLVQNQVCDIASPFPFQLRAQEA
jgi:hypothetical protein